MDYETITVAIEGAVGTLALNNPAKLNALSVACLRDLADAARWFDGHDDVKAVIVRGEGRAFTAGADLAAFTGAGPARAAADAGHPAGRGRGGRGPGAHRRGLERPRVAPGSPPLPGGSRPLIDGGRPGRRTAGRLASRTRRP